MEKDDEYKDFVDGLAAQFRALNDMAVREYTPLVDDICSRIASRNEVERLLDYLLDFAGNDKILLLYRRVCRHYFQIYPDSIAWYIMEYRKEYDRESLIGTKYVQPSAIACRPYKDSRPDSWAAISVMVSNDREADHGTFQLVCSEAMRRIGR